MKWIDMNKLETAIIYVQRIADGNNPVNNVPVEADSVLNNPHVIRCMYFVKEVLEEVKCHGGYTGSKLKKADKQASLGRRPIAARGYTTLIKPVAWQPGFATRPAWRMASF